MRQYCWNNKLLSISWNLINNMIYVVDGTFFIVIYILSIKCLILFDLTIRNEITLESNHNHKRTSLMPNHIKNNLWNAQNAYMFTTPYMIMLYIATEQTSNVTILPSSHWRWWRYDSYNSNMALMLEMWLACARGQSCRWCPNYIMNCSAFK